jgi:TnpA family transposase
LGLQGGLAGKPCVRISFESFSPVLFTLEWLQSPDLRRRVQVGLNKGEAKNALARAVFFNRLGELRDRTFENQRYRARV